MARMRRLTALGLVAVLGLGVAACSSSGDDASGDRGDQLGETLTATTETPRSTTTTAPEPTESELEDLLLTTDEVGIGWAASPPDPSGEEDDAEDPECLADLRELGPERASAEQEWENAADEYFSESLEYAGTEVIADEFEQVTAVFAGCSSVTITSGGTSITGTMAEVPLVAGDMSAAYEITFPVAGRTLTLLLGVVGVDGYELSIAMGQVDDASRVEFEQLTAKAVAKIRSGGGQTA